MAATTSLECAQAAGDAFAEVSSLAVRAAIDLQLGDLDAAGDGFTRATTLKQRISPNAPALTSLRAFWHCDYLIARDQPASALEQATQGLAHPAVAMSPVDRSLLGLAIGRAKHAIAVGARAPEAYDMPGLSDGAAAIERAVDELKVHGDEPRLAQALLMMADVQTDLYRTIPVQQQLELAAASLSEATEIARRTNMRLIAADASLAAARLALAPSARDIDQARHCLERARDLIEQTGYRRREAELARLTTLLDALAAEHAPKVPSA